MRILLLSFFFAPYNTMAAHRATALAGHLERAGHDVKVIAGRHHDLPQEPSAKHSEIETFFIAPPLSKRSRYTWPRSNTETAVDTNSNPPNPAVRLIGKLKSLTKNLLFWPDRQGAVMLRALPTTLALARRWRPDLIYASSPPASWMALGYLTSRISSVPWICEVRDRWADDPYTPRPHWRARTERFLEDRMLKTCKGIVTVSETWSKDYGDRHGKPTLAVYNGFDQKHATPIPREIGDEGSRLRLVYTGSVYAGRDPAPLWRALAILGEEAEKITVEFYGAKPSEVLPEATHLGVAHLVVVKEYVSHEEAIALQCAADVLLLLQWNNPSEAGNVPGKFFEYLGARRPILGLGYMEGELASMVRARGAGLFSNEPEAIARQLRVWLRQKAESGAVPPLPESASAGASREEQFERFEGFIERAIDAATVSD